MLVSVVIFLSTDSYSREEKILACLTGQERAKWWRIRDQHFSRGVNRDTMDMIEKAIFCVRKRERES
jgi:hypothetical protein